MAEVDRSPRGATVRLLTHLAGFGFAGVTRDWSAPVSLSVADADSGFLNGKLQARPANSVGMAASLWRAG